MPYKFKSRATADLIMLDANGRKLLEIIGKSPDEVRKFIVEQLAQREPFYSKANYTLNVDLLDNFTKIQTTIENLRKILKR